MTFTTPKVLQNPVYWEEVMKKPGECDNFRRVLEKRYADEFAPTAKKGFTFRVTELLIKVLFFMFVKKDLVKAAVTIIQMLEACRHCAKGQTPEQLNAYGEELVGQEDSETIRKATKAMNAVKPKPGNGKAVPRAQQQAQPKQGAGTTPWLDPSVWNQLPKEAKRQLTEFRKQH